MNTIRISTTLLCLGLTMTMAARAADGLAEKLKPFADSVVQSEKAVGISIGVIADGETTTVHAGHVKKGGATPNDHTVYEIGSISKVFTGLLLADAVAKDEIPLDVLASELLPRGATMPEGKNEKITLLHLSTHRSGLPRLPSNMSNLASDNPYSQYTSKKAMAFLKSHELRREPGEKYEYSNFATSLLGHLLCEHRGSDYDTVLRKNVTGPMQMNETSVKLNASMKSSMAVPHRKDLNPTSTWEFADLPGAGGIRSTTADMLKFAAANLDPPNDAVGQAIQLAWKEHIPGNAKEFGMGLGWHIARDGQTRWHNGGTGGYRTMLMVNRDIQAAVIVMANTATESVDALAHQIIQLLAGADIKPPAVTKPEKEIDVPVKKMKRLEGRYQLVPQFVFDVRVRDGKLMVGVTNQPTHQVFARSETEWFYKVVDATLTFQMDAQGRCTALELFQNGVRQTAKRITD